VSVDLKEFIRKRFPFLLIIYGNHSMEKIIRDNKSYYDKGQMIQRLQKLYKSRTGNLLNLEAPKRYTEKIQWRKVYDHNPLYGELSDKYTVREWVKNKVGEGYLIPIIGVWDTFDDIDFSSFPNQFVLKTNNASGTNIIVKDKNAFNKKVVRAKIDYWMSMDYAFLAGYEMQYYGIAPKIIAEEYIEDIDGEDDLKDYKFLCFDGIVEYIWVDRGRFHNHTRTVYDKEWNLQSWNQKYSEIKDSVKRPCYLEKMIELAEKLSSGFDHVRVDLYYTGEKIYFGEMTFTNGSGFENIVPDEYDFELGKMWKMDLDTIPDGRQYFYNLE